MIVLNLYERVLVGHDSGGFEAIDLDDGWRRAEFRTACGILLHRNEWKDRLIGPPWTDMRNEFERHYSHLRDDHMALIGRRCQRCARSAST